MTTPLRKFDTVTRTTVALRRYHGKTNGLGFLAARDYLMKTGQMPVEKSTPADGEDAPKKSKKTSPRKNK